RYERCAVVSARTMRGISLLSDFGCLATTAARVRHRRRPTACDFDRRRGPVVAFPCPRVLHAAVKVRLDDSRPFVFVVLGEDGVAVLVSENRAVFVCGRPHALLAQTGSPLWEGCITGPERVVETTIGRSWPSSIIDPLCRSTCRLLGLARWTA